MESSIPQTPSKNSSNPGEETPKKRLLTRVATHRHSHWWALGLTSAILAFLMLTWGIGSCVTRSVRVGSSAVKARDIKTKLPTLLATQQADYRLSLQAPDKQVKKYRLAELGLAIDSDATVARARKSTNSLRARLLWWQKQPVTIVLKSNPAKLTDFINKNARAVTKQVVNTVVEVTPQGTVTTTDSQAGEEVGLVNGERDIVQAVSALNTKPLLLSQHVVEPAITKESTKKVVASLQSTLQRSITFTIQTNQIVAEPGEIAGWFVLTPNIQKRTYDISVDAGKVDDYINAKASEYIRLPRDQVEVVQPDGSVLVLVKGQSGIDVTNKKEISQTLHDKILTDQSLKLTMEVAETPYKTVSANAGDKLIEVDITAKRMYVYESGVLLRTFLVSAGAPATPTVTGTYAIYSKIRSQNMRGFNADGSTYFQPNVSFVNYFYRDYAIHGNYWRPTSYFGNINSSHGCVGITDYDAEWIYNWAPVGTQVVVHT